MQDERDEHAYSSGHVLTCVTTIAPGPNLDGQNTCSDHFGTRSHPRRECFELLVRGHGQRRHVAQAHGDGLYLLRYLHVGCMF